MAETPVAETRRPRTAGERIYWLDRPGSVAKVLWAVAIVCAVLVLLDFFYVKHAKFEMEYLFGFYGWYGLVCCVFMVLAARGLRKLLKRGEDYYDR